MKKAIGRVINQPIYYQLFEVLLAVFSAVCISLLLYNIVYVMPLAFRHGFSFDRVMTALAIWVLISGVAVYVFFKVLIRGLAKTASSHPPGCG